MFVITVRRALMEDSARIAELCAALGYPASMDRVGPRLEHILADARQAVFVAETKEAPVCGWIHVLAVCYLESEPFAEIGGIVVDSSARRAGVGRALMQAAEHWALDQRLGSVRLRSNVIREQAHLFYQSLGYTKEKTQFTFQKALPA